MLFISLYKRLYSFVQNNDFFCTEDCNLLYKMFLGTQIISQKHPNYKKKLYLCDNPKALIL